MTRKPWIPAEIVQLCALYPDISTKRVAARMNRSISSIDGMAGILGLRKSVQYLASPAAFRFRRGYHAGWEYRFPKGHVPANKGLRRPGWAPGRMAETQFKKGNRSKRWNQEDYPVGVLRLNSYGWVDMKIKEGPRAWHAFHAVLWEDAHGPVPKGFVLRFRDRDRLNIDLDNLELISRAENMRRNSIHNLPAPLRDTIQLLGQLKRRINERQDRGSARAPICNA